MRGKRGFLVDPWLWAVIDSRQVTKTGVLVFHLLLVMLVIEKKTDTSAPYPFPSFQQRPSVPLTGALEY